MNSKIKVGIIIENSLGSGGIYSNEISFLNHLENNQKIDFKIFSINKKNIHDLKKIGFEAIFINLNLLDYLLCKIKILLLNLTTNYKFKKIVGNIFNNLKFEKILLNNKINLVHFFSLSFLSKHLFKINYGCTYLDSCHLAHPEFPEIKNWNGFDEREDAYERILKKASYILSPSENCTLEITNRYNVLKSKILEFSFLPQKEILDFNQMEKVQLKKFAEIKNLFNFDNNYLFYPAMLWPHKNHIYILKAISILKKKHKKNVQVVFSGKDRGNKKYLVENAIDLDVEKNIKFIGLVDPELMPHLYKNSFCLVMPTYFGPINIPPIEANYLGVPVIYNKDYCYKDNVISPHLGMNIQDPNDLVENYLKLMDENFRKNLIKSGYEYTKVLEEKNKNFISSFDNYLRVYMNKIELYKNRLNDL